MVARLDRHRPTRPPTTRTHTQPPPPLRGSAMTGPAPGADPLTTGTIAERIAQVSPAARAVHRALLSGFATGGTEPGKPALAQAADGADLDGLLAELHEQDVI